MHFNNNNTSIYFVLYSPAQTVIQSLCAFFLSFVHVFCQIPRLKHPNPFYLGSLKKSLTDRETEEMHNVLKWVKHHLVFYFRKNVMQGCNTVL